MRSSRRLSRSGQQRRTVAIAANMQPVAAPACQSSCLTILRTAAGSAPTVTHYELFRQSGIRVVAADSDPLSVGFVFADAAYVVPMAAASEYIETLLKICEQERVNWLMPALDEELVTVAMRHKDFEQIGTKVLVSPLDSLRICTDKLETYRYFCSTGIPTPATKCGRNIDLSQVTYPQIVKPQSGRGSTNIFVAHNQRELKFFLDYVPEPIVQTYIKGNELTIDVLSDLQARPIFVLPRYRLQTDSGISFKAVTTTHERIATYAARIAEGLRLVGPTNIQCFIDDKGSIWFTEVNARLAGSAALTFAASPGFFEALADLLAGRPIMAPSQTAKPLIMLRYWKEAYIEPERLAGLCRKVSS